MPFVSLWWLHAEILCEKTDLHSEAGKLSEDFRLLRVDLNSCL